MILTEKQKEQLMKELKDNKKCNIFGFFTIEIRPARKGVINGAFGKTPIFKLRPVYKTARSFKRLINGLWK